MKNVYLLVLLIFPACFLGCSKELPDGPAFSLRSKENRIQGTWLAERVIENGDDRTFIYAGWRFIFQKNGIAEVIEPDGLGPTTQLFGSWQLDCNNTDDPDGACFFTLELSGSRNGSPYSENRRYQVQRLSNREFWLFYVSNDELEQIEIRLQAF